MNIDVSKIEGYAEMTAEQKVEALEQYTINVPDNSQEIEALKRALSKANGEASDYKKQLKERMSAEELKAKESADNLASLQEQNEAMKKQLSIIQNKAKYIALGYDEQLAEDTANAIADGDIDKVFANQKTFQDALVKKAMGESVANTPRPQVVQSEHKSMTKAEFDKLSYNDRLKIYNENPEEYEALTSD